MRSVPFGGPDGLNIILGGGIAAWGSDPVQPALIGLDHIYVYNPATKAILNQSASESTFGSTPQPRKQFCSVGSPGSNRTYEIFISGGRNPSLSAEEQLILSDEVFVLSLPGFVWFKAGIPHINQRSWHSCNMIGKGGSQLVVTGGIDDQDGQYDGALPIQKDPDPWPNGINVFDMNTLQWRTEYDRNASAYQTPAIVTD